MNTEIIARKIFLIYFSFSCETFNGDLYLIVALSNFYLWTVATLDCVAIIFNIYES